MKIVTAQEMIKIEQQSFQEEGHGLAKIYMEKAGSSVAKFIDVYLKKKNMHKKKQQSHILLLCGKGNNSGDAYVCGRILCGLGYTVCALQIFPIQEASDLCQLNHKKFLQSGGIVSVLLDDIFRSDLVVDGLLGTGFSGEVKGDYTGVIQKINTAQKKVIAIDIPSGLHPNQGAISKKNIIKADVTLCLELPKIGSFFQDGMNYIGKLVPLSFGLKKKYIDRIQSPFKLITKEICKQYIPKYHRTIHKYQAGFLTVIAGSENMTGAAFLTTLAAFRSGSGMVKLLCSNKTLKALSFTYPELVKVPFDDSRKVSDIVQNLVDNINISSACVIGPGIGLKDKTCEIISQLIPKIKVPVLMDADALTLFSQKSFLLPKSVIMTPHLGELSRLLKMKKILTVTNNLLDKVRLFSNYNKVVVVVKGAPTFVVIPYGSIYVCPVGDPGMATAGSGDVLSGMIGSFLTQHLSCETASIVGVYLHGKAGVFAAKKKTSYSLMASDIIDHISDAIKKCDQA